MSLQSHLTELERRHQAIDREIKTELIHPSISDEHIVELKRKKLQIKDEIRKLQATAPPNQVH